MGSDPFVSSQLTAEIGNREEFFRIFAAKAQYPGGLYSDNLCRGLEIFLFHNHLSLEVI